ALCVAPVTSLRVCPRRVSGAASPKREARTSSLISGTRPLVLALRFGLAVVAFNLLGVSLKRGLGRGAWRTAPGRPWFPFPELERAVPCETPRSGARCARSWQFPSPTALRQRAAIPLAAAVSTACQDRPD